MLIPSVEKQETAAKEIIELVPKTCRLPFPDVNTPKTEE